MKIHLEGTTQQIQSIIGFLLKKGYRVKGQEIELEKTPSEPHEGNKDITAMIGLFSDVNSFYKMFYKQNPQREATKVLIEKLGVKELERVIKSLKSTNSKEFYPTITTPRQLQQNFDRLMSAHRREKGKKKKPYYEGYEMVQKGDEWFVIIGGEFKQFAGEEKDIIWK